MSRSVLILKKLLVLLLTAGSLQTAMADNDEGGSRWWKPWGSGEHNDTNKNNKHATERSSRGSTLSSAPPSQYQKECASCHMAYPAGLLPAGSWQHMMGSLNQHFGNDASLDTSSTNAITQYLTSNSGTYKRVNEMPPHDRITESYWFTRKHDKHVNASTWTRPSVGGRANCVACHQGAEQGNFNEHNVRIPG